MAVTESSGVTTIAKPRFLMIVFVLSLSLAAMIVVLPPASKNPPALAACLVAIAVLTVLGLVRASRDGLRIDDRGVTVRDFFYRSYRFSWPEITRFADGTVLVDHGLSVPREPMWVLLVVLRDGRAIQAKTTVGWRGGEYLKMLMAIKQAAAHYGIPTELTGIA